MRAGHKHASAASQDPAVQMLHRHPLCLALAALLHEPPLRLSCAGMSSTMLLGEMVEVRFTSMWNLA